MKIRKNLPLFVLFILLLTPSFAQTQKACWVYFSDKENTQYDPQSFLDSKAIERRIQHQFNLLHPEDFPVREDYLAGVADIADTVIFASRWFNAAGVIATDEQIIRLWELPFVTDIEVINSQLQLSEYSSAKSDDEPDEYVAKQTEHLGGPKFRLHGIGGKGVRIAVLDAGFPGVNTHEMFEHLRNENRILKTWDFTRNQPNVYLANSHGTSVLSCIAGIYNNQHYGLAYNAEFLLARTEVEKEPFAEEIYWQAAMEWADQNGADIINSSLGYTHHRYFPEQMNGKTAFVSRAALKAAKRGILVVNAAGNEGSSRWKRIGAPADADSILTVGGIHPQTGYHTSFASVGPTSDFRLKPNVTAFAHVKAAGKSDIKHTHGTSFSSPLVAGFAACVKQLAPELTNMQLLHIIQESASLYPYFDYAHGFGVPQADFFLHKELIDSLRQTPTFAVALEDDILTIRGNELLPQILKEGKNLLFINLENEKGILTDYFVVRVQETIMFTKDVADWPEAKKVNIHFAGYTFTLPIF